MAEPQKSTNCRSADGHLQAMLDSFEELGSMILVLASVEWLFAAQFTRCTAKNVLDPVVIPLTTSSAFGKRRRQLPSTR